MGRLIDPDRKRNEPMVLLIRQCLGVEELQSGSFTQFAALFSEFSGIKTSRHNILSWVNYKGIPAEKCKIAEDLSRQYFKTSKIHRKIIRAEHLRPKVFEEPQTTHLQPTEEKS